MTKDFPELSEQLSEQNLVQQLNDCIQNVTEFMKMTIELLKNKMNA